MTGFLQNLHPSCSTVAVDAAGVAEQAFVGNVSASQAMDVEIVHAVCDVLREHARLPVDPATLRESDSLYNSGMTSHATIHVMLALEETFDIEFPDSLLTRNVFASIESIVNGVRQLGPTVLRT